MGRDIAAERRALDEAVAGKTVCSAFQDTVRSHADSIALKWKEGEEWRELTWAEYGDRVRDFANGMIALGLEPGEFVNLMGQNLPEYYVADIGVLHAGGIPVSLYNTLPPEQIEYIANHCEAAFAVLQDRNFYERFLKIRSELPHLRKVVLWEGADEFADDDWVIGFEDVLAAGRAHAQEHPDDFEARWKAVTPDDLCTMIYTSGTTGPPKGVMMSHYNILWTLESLANFNEYWPGMRLISYLPMAHIAERLQSLYIPARDGCTIHFCPDMMQLGTYLAEVKPNLFFGAPRLWEKMYERLNAAFESNPDPEQRQKAKDDIQACIEKTRLEQAGKPVPEELLKRAEEAEATTGLIRQLLGLDECRYVSSGAAPLAAEILEWFYAIGLPILEGYGQSEGAGPTTCSREGEIRVGWVGPPMPGVEVQLDSDGEILFRGGNVMKGYYKDPELTKATIDEDGWLRSGDIGEMSEDGYLRIIDRKKEILITSGGKNVAPSNIENLLKQHPLIGHACAVGDRRPYVTALIVLDPESAAEWAQAHDKPTDTATLSEDPDLVSEIEAYVGEVNERLHRQEQIKRFTILPAEWTVESEEMTPTLKLKRKLVNDKYADVIESMYSS